MRAIILCLALAALPALAQQPPASQASTAPQRLKEKYMAILKLQVTEMLTLMAQKESRFTKDDLEQQADALMKDAEATYGSLLTLPGPEARHLLTAGPDNISNLAAIKRDIELWKHLPRPMPALYKKMQDDVSIGLIKGGLELDLIRRVSEFHLRQLGLIP